MALRPGHAVGPYEILAELGRGGMGTVYLARDRRLGREVALKFLHPPESGIDPARWRQRLTREARAASALNHPNICHIYDIGGEAADSWIAMEYVDGPPLRSTIGQGGLPVDTAVKIAAQLADALAHAHAHGILHRDLTAANVLTDADGRARILDFGIAERLPEEVAQEATHTGTAPASEAFAGTLPYLAPEILKGAPAAPQTDLWSLGVLLYEMLAGMRPFQGRNMLEIVSAILESPPRPLPSRVPAPIARIVSRLLMKNPADRYRSAVEVAAALDAVYRPAARAWRPTVAVAAAAAVVVVLSLLAYGAWSLRRFSPLRVSQQRLLSTTGVSQRTPAYAPDGRRLAFVAPDERGVPQIWVRNLSDDVAIQVTSGDGGAGRPRWSAIDDRIIFSRPRGGIWSVSPLGGAPNQIMDRGTNPDVSRDGSRLVFEDERSLWIADRDGSNVREITGLPPVFYRVPMGPAFSPDGAEIAFFRPEMGPNGDIWVIAAAGGQPRRLTSDLREGGWPAWTPDGRAIVFSSGRAGSRTLWQIPAHGGDPVPLTSGAGEDDQPTISADGRQLAYTNVRNTWDLRVRDLATGDERSLLQRGLELLFPRFSPDGSRLAFFGRLDRAVAIFSIGVDGSDLRQLTGGRELNHQPRWSSDGRSVYFFQVAPTPSLRRVPALGGASTPFRDWGWETHYAPEFDPTGRLVAYVRERGPGEREGEPARTVLHEIATGQERYWPPPHIHVTGWSADGAMAVGSRDDGAMLMCTVPDGACRPLGQGVQPVWPAGGNRIYFRKSAADGITQELWSMGTDGQGKAFVVTLGRFRPIDPWVDVSRQGVATWARFEAGLHQLWAATIE